MIRIKSHLKCPCGADAYYNEERGKWFCKKTGITILDEDLSIHKREAAARPAKRFDIRAAVTYISAAISLLVLGTSLWMLWRP